MNLLKLCKWIDDDYDFFISELSFNHEGQEMNSICVEFNELRLLIITDIKIIDLLKELAPEVKIMVEENTNDGFKETINTIQNVCIEDLMECLVENAMEYYECFDADIGMGGLDETAESELVVPLFLAYDYIRGASAELIYEQFKRTDTDSFIRDFDVSFW